MPVPRTHYCSLCGAAGWYLTDNPVFCRGQLHPHDPAPMDRIVDGRRVPHSPPEDPIPDVDADILHAMATTWRQQANNASNMFTDAERIVWREAAAQLAEAIGRKL